MKKLFACIAFTILTISVKSQVIISLLLGDFLNTGKIEFGLDGGINYPNIRGLDGDTNGKFNLGFYFDIKMRNPQWMIHTGVIVKSTVGTDNLAVYSLGNAALDSAFVAGSVERTINYFHVPIEMKYIFNNHISVEAGIMPALRSKAFDYFTTDILENEDLEYKLDTRDQFARIDLGLTGGLGYRLQGGNGMNLTVRYYYGLLNINKDDNLPKQYNQSIYLAIGIPIGVEKAPK